MHHLHCSVLGVHAPRHLQPLNRAHVGRLGEPRSGRRALAASSLRASRKDDGTTRRDTIYEELDHRSRGTSRPQPIHRVLNPIIRSSATIISRSTHSRTPPTRPACICTASTTARATSGRIRTTRTTRSRANEASYLLPRSSSQSPAGSQDVHGLGKLQRDVERQGARGLRRLHDRPRCLLHRLDEGRIAAVVRRGLVVLLQGQVRRTVHDVPPLALNHQRNAHARRGRQTAEEQDDTARNEGLC